MTLGVGVVVLTSMAVVAAATDPPPPPDGCSLPECVHLSNDTGNVQGELSENGAYVAFRGIPFGQPPVGVLRWESPRPATAIGKGNTLEVKTFKPNCAQSHDGGVAWETLVDSFSEDCLCVPLAAHNTHFCAAHPTVVAASWCKTEHVNVDTRIWVTRVAHVKF